MREAAERFQREIPRWFLPGAVYTFVGAGGKSTAMRTVASLLARTGIRVRITSTTRLGIKEFSELPVVQVGSVGQAQRAVDRVEAVLVMVSAVLPAQEKYAGVKPGLVDALKVRADSVLLVEGDGSRRLPVKAPREHEPVIPARSSAVLDFLGASAIDEPVDALHCYNHEQALVLLGRTGSFLEAEEIARLAAHQDGGRKGVLPGMGFRLVISQGDLAGKRRTASDAIRLALEQNGIEGALASFREGELYETTTG